MHHFQCDGQLLGKVSIWKSYDLDNILIESGKRYKVLKKAISGALMSYQ